MSSSLAAYQHMKGHFVATRFIERWLHNRVINNKSGSKNTMHYFKVHFSVKPELGCYQRDEKLWLFSIHPQWSISKKYGDCVNEFLQHNKWGSDCQHFQEGYSKTVRFFRRKETKATANVPHCITKSSFINIVKFTIMLLVIAFADCMQAC